MNPLDDSSAENAQTTHRDPVVGTTQAETQSNVVEKPASEFPVITPNHSRTRSHKERPLKWEWNWPVLWISLVAIAICPLVFYAVYSFQSTRVASGLWKRADVANAAGDRINEARWLNQLVAFNSNDKGVHRRLALAVNASAKSPAEIDAARRVLSNGLAALDPETDANEIVELRSLLIQRLLELGKKWGGEAERQVLLLNAEPDHPDALRWLALSLFAQVESGEWRPRNKVQFDRNKAYWQWVSVQPVAEVIQLALERNEDSTELMTALLSAYVTRTNFFENPDLEANRSRFEANAKALIEQLKSKDEGKAQWSSYRYAQKFDRDEAKVLLSEIAPSAWRRLQSQSDSLAVQKTKDTPEGTETVSPSKTGEWDVQVVVAYASQLMTDGEFEKSYDQFKRLIDLPAELVPVEFLELAYLGAGRTLWRQAKASEAIDITRAGCERIGPLQGLGLWHALASYSCDAESVEEAKKSLDYLNDAIETTSASLLNSSIVQDEQRRDMQLRLNAIQWHAGVLKAGLDMRQGMPGVAVRSLNSALATTLPIALDQRSYANKLLAKAYAEMGLWDLAAQTLEDAIAIEPDDKLLRSQAADAWRRAGGTTRAAEQMRLSDDGSFEFALMLVQSTIAKQRILPPSQRDRQPIEQAFEEADRRLQSEKESGSNPPRAWFLEALRLSIADDLNQVIDADSLAAREAKFAELVKTNPTVPELQSIAAVSFHVAGKKDESNLALNNLKLLIDKHWPIWIETNIKLALIDGDTDAAKRLIDEATQDGRIPKSLLLDLASALFESSGNLIEACKYLKLKSDALGEADLFRLGSMLVDLEQQEVANVRPAASETTTEMNPAEELDGVVQQLSLLEGGSGSRWRLLKANRLFNRYLSSKNSSELQESARLQAEIVAVRPDWAQALTLGGRIASAQGKSEKAVASLRRAIAEGDNRVSTIFELVRQLNALGRFTEAEVEFGRIAALTDKDERVSELAIGIAERNGRYEQALNLARQSKDRRKDDPAAWLFLSQAALMKAEKVPEEAKALLEEAEQALDEGNRLAQGKDVNLWLYKLRFAHQYRGSDGSRKVLQSLEASPLPEKSKALLSASGYLQLREFDKSKSILDNAIAKAPKDIELKTALAEFYRTIGDQQSLVDTLEELLRLDAKREEIRKALAMALVTANQADGTIPWDRIATLVRNSDGGDSESSRLFHALLYATRGDKSQLKLASESLRELIKSKEPQIADNAIRLSIAIEQRRWTESAALANAKVSAETLIEIRRLFDLLTKRKDPSASDLYQYADFLFRVSKPGEVAWLIEKLESLTPGSPVVLNLQIRLAKANDERNQIPSVVNKWIASGKSQSKKSRLAEAGRILSQLGLVDEGLGYLQKAYLESPKEIRPYVVGLTLAGKLQEAAEVCILRFESDRNPDAIALLADIAVRASGQETLDVRVDEIIQQGLLAFPSHARVQESIGTLRLTQQRHADAYDLLRRAEQLSPNSLLTLNNIAMAAAEIPGLESEGLPRIGRAIEMYGRSPDLLDTLGVVQFRCGMLKEAEATLREAMSKGSDPRFGLHLIQVLEVKKDKLEIQKVLKQLNLSDLRKMILTSNERATVEALTSSLGRTGS